MIIRNKYSHLSDWELIQTIDVQTDALTTTDIERELLSRFIRVTEDNARMTLIEALLETVGGDAEELVKVIEILEDRGCLDSLSLADKLKRADDFYDIAAEGSDIFQQLADLAKHTL